MSALASFYAGASFAAQVEFVATVPLKVEACRVEGSTVCATIFDRDVSPILSARITIADPTQDTTFDVTGAAAPQIDFFEAIVGSGIGTPPPFTDFYSRTDFANAEAAAGGPQENNFGLRLKGTYTAPTTPGGMPGVTLTDFETLARYVDAEGNGVSKATGLAAQWLYEETRSGDGPDAVVLSPLVSGPLNTLARFAPTPGPIAPAPIPVPASLPLALSGIGLLTWIARRRGRA